MTPETWNTPPDFVKLSTRDLIPLLGDLLVSLRDFGVNFTTPRPSLLSLENMAQTLAQYIDQILELISEYRELFQNLVNILSSTASSRLYIPTQDGGVPGLLEAIETANPTRKDFQRITNPGGFGPPQVPATEATLFRNDIVPYDEAVSLKNTDPSVEFRPLENLLIAGVGIVFHPGPLAELLQDIFTPTDEDVAQDDTGDPVYETPEARESLDVAVTPPVPEAQEPPDGPDSSNIPNVTIAGDAPSPSPSDSSSQK